MSAITRFDFKGDALAIVADGERHGVTLASLCAPFDLDVEGQRQKLARLEWATTFKVKAVAEDGKSREVVCLDIKSVNGWLFTLQAKSVRADLRAKLVAYQIECADILADHFLGKRGAPRINTEDAVGVLCQQSMRVCDDEKAERRLRRAIRNAAIATKRSWQSVEGFVRRKSNAPGWTRVALFNVDRIIGLLEDVADGQICIPRPKAKLRLLASANQLPLFDGRRRR